MIASGGIRRENLARRALVIDGIYIFLKVALSYEKTIELGNNFRIG